MTDNGAPRLKTGFDARMSGKPASLLPIPDGTAMPTG